MKERRTQGRQRLSPRVAKILTLKSIWTWWNQRLSAHVPHLSLQVGSSTWILGSTFYRLSQRVHSERTTRKLPRKAKSKAMSKIAFPTNKMTCTFFFIWWLEKCLHFTWAFLCYFKHCFSILTTLIDFNNFDDKNFYRVSRETSIQNSDNHVIQVKL